jgi:geranylgeranyl diphosphate synthase, type I
MAEGMLITGSFQESRDNMFSPLDEQVKGLATELIVAANPHAELTQEAMASLVAVLRRPSKYWRGFLTITGAELYGYENIYVKARAGGIKEVTHTSLLVDDDIFDRSPERREGEAAHILMGNVVDGLPGNDNPDLGRNLVMNISRTVGNLMLAELERLPIPDDRYRAISRTWNNLMGDTGFGQSDDMVSHLTPGYGPVDATRTAILKSGRYTVKNPLLLGSGIAGRPKEHDGRFTAYAENFGIAFQLGDDLLWVRGVKESGKDPRDDLRQNTRSRVILKALEMATPAGRHTLATALGNRQLTMDHFEATRQVILSSGAVEETIGVANYHASKAKDALADAPREWRKEPVSFMGELASRVVIRDA